ncbi:hypothetical protein MSPP1_004053 [Malassezia sp. CBS 17886]|nr:hypothetical protein MSPP1_004053 [Malassezia sp. CBS 17886]
MEPPRPRPAWLAAAARQGRAPYHADAATYAVFRDVREYGAAGDGRTDDTAAINRAIADGARCADAADSSTTAPALVYFPPGAYRVSAPIVALYNTHLLGDPSERPRLVPLPHFAGIAVIDENPYRATGANWYTPQNNFFRAVANFVVDLTQMPAGAGTGIHHQVSQATGLSNMHFEMVPGPHSMQQGIFMENASGGFMSDLSFRGGRFGAWLGNQQFTVRNARFEHCRISICQHWNWAWTYMDVTIRSCEVGIHVAATRGTTQGVGALVLADWSVADTPVAVELDAACTARIVLDGFHVRRVGAIVQEDGARLLAAPGPDDHTVASWVHAPRAARGSAAGMPAAAPTRPRALVDARGKWFGREKPLFPHGVYVLRNTLHIPVGTRIMGEAQPVLLGTGARFNDALQPRPVIRVAHPGDRGEVTVCDLMFSTRAPAAGAIVVEWNVHESAQGSAAMFDTHIRIGGFRGSNLEMRQCDKTKPLDALPRASFLSLHVTTAASGYFQNVWVWVADHNLDDEPLSQINVLSGRGILIESRDGPVWLYGTASEHHLLYQYSLVHARNVLLAMIQTETPYFQGHGFAPASQSELRHPAFPDPDCALRYDSGDGAPYAPALDDRALGLHMEQCESIFLLGAGLYSFFDAYAQDSLAAHSCQRRLCTVDDACGPCSQDIWLFNVATVGCNTILSERRVDAVPEDSCRDGFCSTMAVCALLPRGGGG